MKMMHTKLCLILLLFAFTFIEIADTAEREPKHRKGLYGNTKQNRNKRKGSGIKKLKDAGEDQSVAKRGANLEQATIINKSHVVMRNLAETSKNSPNSILDSQNSGIVTNETGKIVESRSGSSNFITDLKVPAMGAAMHGNNNTTAGNGTDIKNGAVVTNDSENSKIDSRCSSVLADQKIQEVAESIHENTDNITGVSEHTNQTVESEQLIQNHDLADARSPDALSNPQIPKLGASIVGIVDNSNHSNRADVTGNQTSENGTSVGDSPDSVNSLKNYLDTLDDIANSTAETANLVNASVRELKGITTGRQLEAAKDVPAKKKHEIIGPHYYEPECDDEKKCRDGHYCRMYVCVECHRAKHACTERKQCCNNMECVYGRCEDKPKGSPGAFCHKDGECGDDACCVLEPTVDEEHAICKPKLAEYHQCSPILYRKIWIGDDKPDCGPCKGGLQCVQRGVEGSHEVCMKKA